MALIAALLAAAGLAHGAQAAPIRADLDRGYWAVQDLGRCLAELPDGEGRYETAMARFWAAYERAEGLYGPDPVERSAPASQPACDAAFAAASETRAADAFAAAEARLSAAEALISRGLWAGSYPLCADTVQTAERVRRKGEGPAVRLTVKDAGVGALAAWAGTEDAPARLAIRLDGLVVAVVPLQAPVEPKLEVEGLDEPTLVKLTVAAKAAC
ncbi:hypothetical protein [Caulobacter sp. 17J80-11]|uniref:hypothetical protein n=1 Tax=Caulobacter sp. 17J80-11 TaxID=2763502 RepID=UPI0016536A64|nr:hypothetical protein [Caulobacter sp. 17J80-11]MBC6981349.1 hypothetical protein [Caulobacter sp. 17J80-11]